MTTRPGGNATEPEREELEEISTADWNRMLAAWQQFQQQATDLRSIADGDAESIIRQVGHTITALDMIESTGWTHSCAAELGAWESLGSDAVTPDAAHSAATAVADAGDLLMQHWHAALNAGNYDSTQLNDVQAAFLDACAHARAGLHH